MIASEVQRTSPRLSLRAYCDSLGVADVGTRRIGTHRSAILTNEGMMAPCKGVGLLMRRFGRFVICFLISFHMPLMVFADLPRFQLRISVTANGEFRMNGVAASRAEVKDALEKLSPEQGVVQLYGENQVPSPYGPHTELALIIRRSLPVQFAFKPDFSDITENTPAMRIHPSGTARRTSMTTFTDCISDVCPVHHKQMAITQVGMSRGSYAGFVPTIRNEDRDARYPFRGAAIDRVFFSENADVYVCPSCFRDYAALIKKNTETPQMAGKWTVYVSIRGVPKELWNVAVARVFHKAAIADAGEPFAFGCVAMQGEPRQGFVLAGTQGDVGFVIWQQGGAACVTRGAFFRRSYGVWTNSNSPTIRSDQRPAPFFDIPSRRSDGTIETYLEAIEARIRGTP